VCPHSLYNDDVVLLWASKAKSETEQNEINKFQFIWKIISALKSTAAAPEPKCRFCWRASSGTDITGFFFSSSVIGLTARDGEKKLDFFALFANQRNLIENYCCCDTFLRKLAYQKDHVFCIQISIPSRFGSLLLLYICVK
jgi:hypothetical protein